MSKKVETYDQQMHRHHTRLARKYSNFPNAAEYHKRFAAIHAPPPEELPHVRLPPYKPAFRAVS